MPSVLTKKQRHERDLTNGKQEFKPKAGNSVWFYQFIGKIDIKKLYSALNIVPES